MRNFFSGGFRILHFLKLDAWRRRHRNRWSNTLNKEISRFLKLFVIVIIVGENVVQVVDVGLIVVRIIINGIPLRIRAIIFLYEVFISLISINMLAVNRLSR